MCLDGNVLKPVSYLDFTAVVKDKKHHVVHDFGTIRGNHLAKRALAIAAAGMHNVIMI